MRDAEVEDDSSSRARQARLRKSRRSAGLVEVSGWVPERRVSDVRGIMRAMAAGDNDWLPPELRTELADEKRLAAEARAEAAQARAETAEARAAVAEARAETLEARAETLRVRAEIVEVKALTVAAEQARVAALEAKAAAERDRDAVRDELAELERYWPAGAVLRYLRRWHARRRND